MQQYNKMINTFRVKIVFKYHIVFKQFTVLIYRMYENHRQLTDMYEIYG